LQNRKERRALPFLDQNLALADVVGSGDDAFFLHLLDQTRGLS
jgi:hypothetical protein